MTRAMLCPASRWANIHATTGAVAEYHLSRCAHRPHAACAFYPRTWGRRLLGARIRRPALITEVRTSLAGLDAHLQPSKADALPGRS